MHSQHGVLRGTGPYDGAALFSWLRTHIVPGIEELKEGMYSRSVLVAGVRGITRFTLGPDGAGIEFTLSLEGDEGGSSALTRWRQALDLDVDPVAVHSVLTRDPLLAPLIAARPGLRVWGAFDGFELAVRAILGQQVSVAGACTLLSRVVARVGEPAERPMGTVTRYFPTAEALAQANLDGLGITGARIRAIHALSEAVRGGEVRFDRGGDAGSTLEALQSLPGIGPWTVQYVAMRALGDADACPVTDLGLRRALEAMGVAADPKSVAARAEHWRPWRAYATQYLWSTLPGHRPE